MSHEFNLLKSWDKVLCGDNILILNLEYIKLNKFKTSKTDLTKTQSKIQSKGLSWIPAALFR